jgi:plastocyanin
LESLALRTSDRKGIMKRWNPFVSWLPLAQIVVIFLVAGVSRAHGPTIELTHSEMKPALLNLFVGSTVHFLNKSAMPGGHVVVDRTGRIESPPLEQPGDGWHYTFDEPGSYEVFVRQHPKAAARINVIEKSSSP